MGNRLDLQMMLENLLETRNVYFQPPASIRMSYPAIKFELQDIKNNHAGDSVYSQSRYYKLTVIDYDADSKISDKVSKLPSVRWNTHYKADNLNHFVYTIYY